MPHYMVEVQVRVIDQDGTQLEMAVYGDDATELLAADAMWAMHAGADDAVEAMREGLDRVVRVLDGR